MILRKIAPGSFELNNGLFVAITDEDMAYRPAFLEGLETCGIPYKEITPQEALRREPNLNPEVKAAVEVPDGTMDAMRLPLRFFATAQSNGAVIKTYTEVEELLMQFQADILGVPVVRPKVAETTSLGASYAAGLAVGFWNNLDDLRANWQVDHTWEPKMDAGERARLYKGWLKAVERTFNWVE